MLSLVYMRTSDILYLAGFFDGEGYVSVSVLKHKWSQGFYVDLRAGIGNTNRDVLVWIQRVTKLGKVWKHQKKGNRRLQHHWVTSNLQDTRKFLKLILPYLKVKKKTVELALKYLDSRLKDLESTKKRVYTGTHPYTKEEIEIIRQIKFLNAVGKDKKKYEIFCQKLKNWKNSSSKKRKEI